MCGPSNRPQAKGADLTSCFVELTIITNPLAQKGRSKDRSFFHAGLILYPLL